MGRNNKPETQPETQYQEAANSNQNYAANSYHISEAPNRQNMENNQQNSSMRAVTESESMARDIKEGRLSGFVGSGTMLTGETNFKAMLRVDGHLTGKVVSEGGTLIIGTTGQVDANVHVAAAVINGAVNGDIVATERIELGRAAKVIGNIQTPSLMMEQGAILEGGCNMIKQKSDHEKRSKRTSENEETANNNRESISAPPYLNQNRDVQPKETPAENTVTVS
ncbi:MAG: polymer-forming cytoskeletal protein [Pyrinomonadaceae bacterium]|nr:polymer-forming cytoskeletal protein [Pyrinomonadaceae bacterium]